MTRDNYYAALSHAGLRFEIQDGALVNSTDSAAGSDSALCDLRQLAVLAMRGRDARKFLQGYLTCDVNALTPDRWLMGALCNIQGRMIGTMNVIGSGSATDEAVLMYLSAATLPVVQQTLAKYAVFAKAKLQDETSAWVGIGLIGANAAEAIRVLYGVAPATTAGTRQTVAPAPGPDPSHATGTSSGNTFELLSHGPARWELWLPIAAAATAWEALSAMLPVGDNLRWQCAGIADGVASISGATTGEYLPQAFNLDLIDAVSFSKGCYLGQEIVTRLQHRGESKRRLYRIAVPSTTLTGDRINRSDGRAVGEVVQIGRNSAGGFEALAVLDRNDAGGALHLPAGPVALLKLPYPFAD